MSEKTDLKPMIQNRIIYYIILCRYLVITIKTTIVIGITIYGDKLTEVIIRKRKKNYVLKTIHTSSN